MAPGKPAADFNAIINADRQRRKNEALAEEIFSKNRRSSAPGSGINNRKPGSGPSLASRIGISKRTTSNSPRPSLRQPVKAHGRPTGGDVDAEWTHDLHSLNNPSASRASQLSPHARPYRGNRNENLRNALNGSASSPALNGQFNIVGAKKSAPQISIRGLAGPYVVMAKNFVSGTTIADIESAMTPVGGIALSCRIIAERPNVIAEIVFETKEGADNVVDTFNNQNADGNILHVYHKIGGPAPKYPVAHAAPAARSAAPLGLRADTLIDRVEGSKPSYGASDRYAPRGRSRDRRRDYESRDEVTDGSYGFDDRMDTDDYDNSHEKSQGGLYSDSMVGNRTRGRANSRERGRGNDRGRSYR